MSESQDAKPDLSDIDIFDPEIYERGVPHEQFKRLRAHDPVHFQKEKNGRGYYTYDPDTRASTPDPEVEQMIRDFGQRQGVIQRDITDREVLERCLFPMVNEGARILDERIAIRASDIDVIWINGYGWPVYTGGPMFWADALGLGEVAAKIDEYGARLGGAHWAISPLLARLAADATTFQAGARG